MRLRYPILLVLLCLGHFAQGADTTEIPAANRTGNFLPNKVEGVSTEDLAKLRRAAVKAVQDENFVAARQHLQDLRTQAEYASADDKKSMKNDFETAFEKFHQALVSAIITVDNSITKELADKFVDSLEDRIRGRAKSTATAATKSKTDAEKTTSNSDTPPKPRDPSATKQAPAVNRGGFTMPENIDGISPEDIAKYRTALVKSFRDPELQAARQHMQDLTQKAQFYTPQERNDMRADFEAAIDAVRQKTRSAIAKNDPSLTTEVITKIGDTIEANMRNRTK
jgi:hypothetical protein